MGIGNSPYKAYTTYYVQEGFGKNDSFEKSMFQTSKEFFGKNWDNG